MNTEYLVAVGLCLTVLFTGCSAPGSGPTTPTPDPVTVDPDRSLFVRVASNDAVTVGVTVVAPDNDGVRVQYADGTARTYPGVDAPSGLPDGALTNATGVEPTAGESSMTFDVAEGSGGGVFGWIVEPSTVLYSVSGEDGLLRWGVLSCSSGALSEIRLSVTGDAVSASRVCAS